MLQKGPPVSLLGLGGSGTVLLAYIADCCKKRPSAYIADCCKKRPKAYTPFTAGLCFEQILDYGVAAVMAGYNKCTWLSVGRAERCGSRCKNTLCGIHRSMQKHRKIEEAHLCRKCGKGTKAESRLCSKACGSDRVKKTLHRAEARARRTHKVLMNELLGLCRCRFLSSTCPCCLSR